MFWSIIERLRECSDYMSVCDYNLIAYDLRVDSAKVKSIICDFGLFAFTEDGKCFYSNSLMERMQIKEEKSNNARKAALIKWELERKKSDGNAGAMQMHSGSNAIKEKKGNKRNEIKGNGLPPTPQTDFEKFQEWVNANALNISKMAEPFTEEQFLKVKLEYGSSVILAYATRMHNWKDLKKKNTSAYLTMLNWIRKDNLNNNQKPKMTW